MSERLYDQARQPERRDNVATRWGDSISEERQHELRAELDEWKRLEADHGRRKSPFDASHVFWEERERLRLTGADVFWLAALVFAGADGADPTSDAIAAAMNRLRAPDPDELYKHDLWVTLHLEGANLRDAQLEGANLSGAYLEGAFLDGALMTGAILTATQLERASLIGARLQGANLERAHLEGAYLPDAYLQGAYLSGAHLEGADLGGAHLEGTSFYGAYLVGASFSGASFDKTSRLNSAQLDRAVLDQVIFDNTNLTVVDWSAVQRLGDERRARKDRPRRPDDFRAAARAYRSLAVALRAQGLSAHATRFHYRAELMDRYALLYELRARLLSRRFYTVPTHFLRWLGSWGLGTFAGYGDYVGRLFLTYAVVVCAFATLIFVAGHQTVSTDHIRDALVLSVTSFHGRGLQPPGLPLDDAIAALSGAEAIFGLLIEGIFIAAFTRRVTGN